LIALALVVLTTTSACGPGTDHRPSVDSPGSNTLVVWADRRRGGLTNIYGARVSESGKVLDPAGIAISTARDSQLHPQVAFDGVNYLVVWSDNRAADEQSDVYGARVTPTGVVLDRTGIPIATAVRREEEEPAVAFDGTNYLVVWSDWRRVSSDIYGARVNQAGTVLDQSGFSISRAPNGQRSPQIAFDGTNYLVVWSDARTGGEDYDVVGARVSRDGTVLDPPGLLISKTAGLFVDPVVAYGGGDYLVAWSQAIGLRSQISGKRMSQAGTVRDSTRIRISAAGNQSTPRIAFDGENYLVVWGGGRGRTADVYGSRVTKAGSVLAPRGRPITRAAGHQWVQSIDFNGANYFVAWEQAPSSPYAAAQTTDVYGARVSRAGARLDRRRIALPSAKRRRR
jgi:hypothetical protein